MRKYKVTILDKDTLIERVVDIMAESAREAHKSAIWSLNDYETEEVSNIKGSDGSLFYTSGKGFVDISDTAYN